MLKLIEVGNQYRDCRAAALAQQSDQPSNPKPQSHTRDALIDDNSAVAK